MGGGATPDGPREVNTARFGFFFTGSSPTSASLFDGGGISISDESSITIVSSAFPLPLSGTAAFPFDDDDDVVSTARFGILGVSTVGVK